MSPTIAVMTLEHFDQNLPLPFYASNGAAGADICASLPLELRGGEGQGIVIEAGERKLIPTGLKLIIPEDFEVQVRSRSGLCLKQGVVVANSPGTIDWDYRGEIGVVLHNISQQSYLVTHGMRIAQLVVAPVVQASFVSAATTSDCEAPITSERGSGGFGSTGLNP